MRYHNALACFLSFTDTETLQTSNTDKPEPAINTFLLLYKKNETFINNDQNVKTILPFAPNHPLSLFFV